MKRNPTIHMEPPANRSSQIQKLGYDVPSEVMVIEFLNHVVYHYQHVPLAVFDEIRYAASAGHALAVTVKSDPMRFAAHRVTAPQECDCFELEAEAIFVTSCRNPVAVADATCPDCGRTGKVGVSTDQIVHKTMLCNDCIAAKPKEWHEQGGPMGGA